MRGLTAVVPYWNGQATIGRLLDSLPPDLPVVVVDDASDEPFHTDRANVRTIRQDRGYFAGAVNTGFRACETDVLVLNQDAALEGPAWLDLLAAKRDGYAIVGDGVFSHPAWPAGYVQGTFMFVRRDAWDRVGPFNARDYPLWGATCEWQVRACRLGFRALPLPEVPGLVHGSDTRCRVTWRDEDGQQQGITVGAAIGAAIKRDRAHMGWFLRTPPLVSVVIPFRDEYGHGQLLPQTVASLVGGFTSLRGTVPPQTFASFEAIVVDDASPDPTVAQAVADPWTGVRVVRRQRQGGTAAANNTGIQAAYGRYIAILGADDLMDSGRLEALYRAAVQYPDRFVYDGLAFFTNDDVKPFPLPDFDECRLYERNMIHAGIMFPKRVWEDVGGYPEAMRDGREDWAFNVALVRAGCLGHKLDGIGYLYRHEGQNRTMRNTTPQWRRRFQEQMSELFPDVYGEGGRLEMCKGCGGPRRSNPRGGRSTNMSKSTPLPGMDGFAEVEYVGTNVGDMHWWGIVSGARYYLGGVTRRGLVDARDLETGSRRRPGLLEIKEGGRAIFRLVPAPSVPAPAPARKARKAPKISTAPVPEPAPAVVVEQTADKGANWTVAPADDLTLVKGVGRKTADALEAAGIRTIAQLAASDIDTLVEQAGITRLTAGRAVRGARDALA